MFPGDLVTVDHDGDGVFDLLMTTATATTCRRTSRRSTPNVAG